MGNDLFSKKNHFSLRKLSVGVCSVIIGTSLFGQTSVQAMENDATTSGQPTLGQSEPITSDTGTSVTSVAASGENVTAEVAANQPETSTSSSAIIPKTEVSNSPTVSETNNSTTPAVVDTNTYTLTYTAPAATTYQGWESEALPIGNGEMGAKIFGLVGEEKIQFNEKTLWSGGPTPDSTTYNGGSLNDKYKIIPEIQAALERGDVATAKQLAESQLVGPYSSEYGRYLSFGDVFINFTNQSKDVATVTDYKRDLDIKTAVSSTSYTQDGTTFKREHFASFPDDVTVTRLTKTGDKALEFDVSMRLTTDMQKNYNAYDENSRSTYKTGTVTYTNEGVLLSGEVTDNKMKFASFLGIDTDGVVTRHDDKLSVRGASYATLLMNAKTDYALDPTTNYRRKNANVVNEVKAVVAAAKTKSYDQLKADHVADYKSLFDRVKLNLTDKETATTTNQLLRGYTEENGQQLEEMFFQYGRYLMITSSRDKANALPANLQGVWNAVDNPPWNSDYHLNVNLQMNYWPVFSTNIAETAIPLINYIDDLRYYGRVAAEEYGNIVSRNGEENGWLVHTQTTPFGWTTPGWNYYWGWSPAANAWIMQNVYEHYKFTQDKSYLESKIYPMLKETAKFWNSFLHYDATSDRYVSSPSYSPEHGTITIGNTFDQSLIWQLFHDYMEAANVLNKDADLVAEIKTKFDKLKPLHINAAGRIKEWYEEDDPNFKNTGVEANHRHISHLVGLFPGTLFSKDTPEYLEAARATLNDRGDGGTGWSKANKINLWARLLDGNRAHHLLAEQLKGSTLNNLWDTHTPFQIDGNFGATSGMAEMLLQSHTGYIAPLAALPDAWKTGQVSGLVARGNVEVAMAWKEKNLTSMTLNAKSGGALQIDYPKVETATVKVNGQKVDFSIVQGDRIEVQTKAGDIVEISNILPRITDLTAKRTGENSAELTFSPIDGATYYRIERVGQDAAGQNKENREFSTTETTYRDTTVQSNYTYTYKVAAVLPTTKTAWSNEASISDVKTVMDDRDATIKYGSIFGDWGDTALHAGTEKYADLTGKTVSEADATATIPFVGTGIQIYGLKHGGLGKAYATIDGKDVGEVDFYATGATQKGVLIKEFTGLSDGAHTLTLRVNPNPTTRTGEKNKISLDYFRVLTASPSSTETLDDRDSRVKYGAGYAEWADASLYSGTEKYIDVTGNSRSEADRTATLTFNGTGIQVYGLKSTGLGKATVTIDGKTVDPLVFNKSGATEKGVLIGEYRNLSDGEHTIAITVAPESVNGSQQKISLDKFVILKAPVKQSYPAQLADVTTTDNKLTLTLPEGDWSKVEITLPNQTAPIVVTKSGDDVTVTNGTKETHTEAGKINIVLPPETAAGLVQAVTYQGTVVTGKAFSRISNSIPTAPLTRTETKERQVTTTINFDKRTVEDDTLEINTTRIVQPGRDGRIVKWIRETFENGVLTKTEDIRPEDTITEKAVEQIEAVGILERLPRYKPTVLKFETERIEDPTLEEGQEVIVREGKDGSVTEVYTDLYVKAVLKTEGTTPVSVQNEVKPQNRIVKVGTLKKVERLVERTLPFNTEYINDATLDKGTELVIREGQDGLVVDVYQDTFIKGVKQSEGTSPIRTEERRQVVSRQVRVGTKSVITTRQRTETEHLDPQEISIDDPSLLVGETVIDRPGEAGQIIRLFEEIYTDGVKTGERLLRVDSIIPPVSLVKRIGTRVATVRDVVETLTPETLRISDPDRDLGEEFVAQEGVSGRVTTLVEDIYTKGVKTGERVVGEKDRLEPLPKIILVGSRPVVNTHTERREVTTPIAFTLDRIDDPTLPIGEEIVVREGQAGSQTEIYEDTYENSIKVDTRLIELKTVTDPETKIVRVGTKVVNAPAQPETSQPIASVDAPVQPETSQPTVSVDAPAQPEANQPSAPVGTPVQPETSQPAVSVDTPAQPESKQPSTPVDNSSVAETDESESIPVLSVNAESLTGTADTSTNQLASAPVVATESAVGTTPAVSQPAPLSGESKATDSLPETGEESSAMIALGAATLLSAIGITSVKRQDD